LKLNDYVIADYINKIHMRRLIFMLLTIIHRNRVMPPIHQKPVCLVVAGV